MMRPTGWSRFRDHCRQEGIEPPIAFRIWHLMDGEERGEWMPRKLYSNTCKECGAANKSIRENAQFCCHVCANIWNNRRLMRGAEMYDLVMSMRFERATAKEHELWTTLCRVSSAYRAADKTHRAGRQSWKNIKKALSDIPQGYSTEGDGR